MRERWTEQDDKRLLFSLGAMPLPQLAKALNRSPRAIEERCKRSGRSMMRAVIKEHGMSTQQCADALGTHRQRIQTWIDLGWLQARRHTIRKRHVLSIDHEALETFLRTTGGLLNGLRPDKEWRETIRDAQRDLRARYIDRAELAIIFCFDRQAFGNAQWLRKHCFPPPALRLQQRCCWYERAVIREWLRTAHPRYRMARTLRAFGLDET